MSETNERTSLLEKNSKETRKETRRVYASGLSVIFAVICVVDVFGVFPLVSLSKSIIDCGLWGVFIVPIVSGVQIYTATLLGRCWLLAEEIDVKLEDKNRYPYAALAEITYGKWFSKFVTFLLEVTIFGGGIPNLILASQNLQILGLRVSENEFDISSCYWIIIVGTILCPLMWLGSPKDMKLVCTFSVTMVATVFTLVFGCIILDFNSSQRINGTDDGGDFRNETIFEIPLGVMAPPAPTLWQNLIVAYGILVFQFDVHPSILTIQVDMEDKTKIARVVAGGFLISLGMFTAITLAAYFRYGDVMSRSLLGTLPSSVALHFSALLVAVQLGLTSAVGNNALYQHIEQSLGIERSFNRNRCLLRTSLSLVAILLAESVPRLDVIMSLIGGTFVGPLVFLFPPLIFLRMLKLKRQKDEEVLLERFINIVYNGGETKHEEVTKNGNYLEICFCYGIILLGILGTASTTYLNIDNTIKYSRFSPTCVSNLTRFLT